VQNHPDRVRKYLGTVVPYSDKFFATLNSAIFSDGSFAYIPKGVRCPMELSTYFRINAKETGQFERTLIIAEEGSYVSYLERCTAPMRDENQRHAAVVELVALDNATIKYSTVQNWYPEDKEGKGGIYNFVTKRGKCLGTNSKITWTQVETESAITWKYPGLHAHGRQLGRRVLLGGDNQQLAAGRYRHEDDSPGTQWPEILQQFSLEHRAWLATVDRVRADSRERVEGRSALSSDRSRPVGSREGGPHTPTA
jgi:Fe-S cluster assembly scaffold protein SufB